MKVQSRFTRMLSVLLSMVLIFTMIPQALFAADDENSSWTMESPTVIKTDEGYVELNDDWTEKYRYGHLDCEHLFLSFGKCISRSLFNLAELVQQLADVETRQQIGINSAPIFLYKNQKSCSKK